MKLYFYAVMCKLGLRHVIPGEVRVDIVTIRQFVVYGKHGGLPLVCSCSYPEQQMLKCITVVGSSDIWPSQSKVSQINTESGGTFKKTSSGTMIYIKTATFLGKTCSD